MTQMDGSLLSRRIGPARILERDDNNLIMLVRLVIGVQAGPRLRSLYEGGFVEGVSPPADSTRAAQLVTSRALILRGMRMFGVPPVPIRAQEGKGPNWPDGITGAISYGGGWVGLWLSRDPIFPGLNLTGCDESHLTDGRAARLSQNEVDLLARLPSLQRMTPLERISGAVSAKRALAKAMTPRVGELFDAGSGEVVFAEQSGITFALTKAIGPGLPCKARIHCRLCVLPDVTLSWVPILRYVSRGHPPQSGVTETAPAGGRISSISSLANLSHKMGKERNDVHGHPTTRY